MPSVNMIHPTTGRVQAVDEKDAAVYARLGYVPESTKHETARATEAGREEYYTSPAEKLSAGVEGVLSGASLGLSDAIFGDETSTRADYNPGTRLVGELVGALGTGHIPYAPAGLAARAGKAVGGAIGKGIVAKGVGLGVEGAIQGAGAGLSNAALSGDPETAEAILSGAGLGFATGMGLGVLSGAAGRAGERASARVAGAKGGASRLEAVETRIGEIKAELASREVAKAERVVAEDTARAEAVVSRSSPYEHVMPESDWGATRGAFRNAADDLASAADQVDNVMGAVTDKNYQDMALAATKRVYKEFSALAPEVQTEFAGSMKELRRTASALERDRSNVGVILAHESALTKAAEEMGVNVGQLPQAHSAAAKRVADQAEKAALIADALDDLPTTIKGFASLTDNELTTLAQAASEAKGMQAVIGPRAAMAQDALEAMVSKVGMNGPEDLVTKLKQLRGTLRKVEPEAIKAGETAAKSTRRLEKLKLQQEMSALKTEKRALKGSQGLTTAGKITQWGVGLAGAKAGSAIGLGPFLGYHAATSLLHLKTKVLNGVSSGIARLAGPVSKGLSRAVPLAPRLLFASSLIGDEEPKSDVVQASQQRIDELVQVAPHIEDVAMASVQSLSADHPELAAEMAKSMTVAVKYLAQVMPKDPGTVYMRGVSVWKPSPVQARDFAERWYTVMNPGQAQQDFIDGKLSPVAVHALANAWPALYEAGRQALLKELPAYLPQMSKSQRSRAGFLLGVPLDGTAAPSFVDFLQKNLATAPGQGNGGIPGPGASPGAGRPPGPDESALTDAERILLK